MYQEDGDYSCEGSRKTFLQYVSSAISKVFIKLCGSFNSRTVTVKKNSRLRRRDYYRYEQIGSSGLSLLTENFLRGNLIQIQNLREQNPGTILKMIDDFYDISRDATYLLIAADICRFFAEKTENEDECIKFHLSAFRYSYRTFLLQVENAKQHEKTFEKYLLLQILQIINESMAGIFRYLKMKTLLDSCTFTLHGIDDMEFTFAAPEYALSVPRSAVSDFSLCSDHHVRELRLINRHSGIGVPLVAQITEQNLSSSIRTPSGLTIPVTMFIQVKEYSGRKMVISPVYQDTSLKEHMASEQQGIKQKTWMLARDYTTPLACFMGGLSQRNLLSGMLHPVKYDELSGLYMVEPYNPEKIPVVFVHGLMSSPETWGQMINSLKFDPVIRQKYQFWFFYYSTGTPVMYSAKKLRMALAEAQKEFCTTPEASRNFEQMVLVGHSMGGLLVKLLLQKNPYRVIEYFSHQSWEEVRKKLSPKEQELIEKYIYFDPVPFVRRAVFMAVPHRGADMAKKGLAHLGIRLIKLPAEILSKTPEIELLMKKIMPDFKVSWNKNSFITGIDNLSPDSIYVKWTGDTPLREDVVFHSIIGNQKGTVPGGSDGIVPYRSSHLNNVASEYIVQSGHNVQAHPAAIRELLRILLLHLKENEQPLPMGSKAEF